MKSVLLLFLLVFSSVEAQEPDSSSALFQLREAERNFARESVMHGRNASFVNNFADNAIIHGTTWVTNGKQVWQEGKIRPIVLKWEPEFMDISGSRDFGISTGPWEMQEYRPYTAPQATGYFISVWKKQPGGVWQVILDDGSSAPAQTGYKHLFSFPAGADKTVINPKRVDEKITCTELNGREKQFLDAWKSNPTHDTYTSFLGQQARLQRNDHLPTTNQDTIKAWILQLPKTLTWETAGSGAASSGDLGFTYGYFDLRNDSKGSKGQYVRIWKKQPAGEWKISLEMMSTE